MTPLIATDAALQRPDLQILQPTTTQLEKTAMSDAAPWLYSALSQLRDLESSGRVIRGIGDLRVTGLTAMTVRLLLSLIDITDLPVPVLAPVSGGAISVTWSMGEKEVKFSCNPDGQTMFFKCDEDDVVQDGVVNLGVPASVKTPLRWMLQAQL